MSGPSGSGGGNSPLPEGTRLDAYRIVRQVSLGGFSIVYLAEDDRGGEAAIKEYLPQSLSLRRPGELCPRVDGDRLPLFRYGMKCFFEEGRTLARINHPNVVRVLNFFRANDTVYMAMRFEHGHTLHEHIRRHGRLPESFLRPFFTQLLNGLREVHARRLLHLDVKPSNIYVRDDGSPVLLDFGAARETLLKRDEPMLEPMYTPGYASPEQHGDHARLGPWSDIYGVGASLYACVTGETPPPALQRLERDGMAPAALRGKGVYSPAFLAVIDACLVLDHRQRPQSVLAVQRLLGAADAESAAASGTHLAAAGPWWRRLGLRLFGGRR